MMVRRFFRFTLCVLLTLAVLPVLKAADLPVSKTDVDEYEGYRKGSFHGFVDYSFRIDGAGCHLVLPKEAAEGKPWVIRARFWGRFTEVDIGLLKEGFALAYIDVPGLFGNDKAMARFDALYEQMTTRHGLSKKVVLQGMSRGGMPIMNWAAKRPEKVSVAYSDSGVLDFKSWPGGKGTSKGNGGDWRQVQKVYGLSEAEAMAYTGNPVDSAAALTKTDVAILILTGSTDDVVPQDENGLLYAKNYAAAGGKTLKVIIKTNCGHHPHGMPSPGIIVDFIKAHTAGMGGTKEYERVELARAVWEKRD